MNQQCLTLNLHPEIIMEPLCLQGSGAGGPKCFCGKKLKFNDDLAFSHFKLRIGNLRRKVLFGTILGPQAQTIYIPKGLLVVRVGLKTHF